MKIITSTQCRRPKYTKEFISYLSKAKDIENYLLTISIDGENEEVIGLCKSIDFCKTEISINKTPLGINQNTLKVLNQGFELSDYVLHIEEDCIVSREILIISEELKKKVDKDTFSISFYNKCCLTPEYHHLYSKRNTFVSVGPFGLFKDKFYEAINGNCFKETPSYDINMHYLCEEKWYHHIYTLLGQSNNIGAEGGCHVPNPEWHKEKQFCDFWAETIGFEKTKEMTFCDNNIPSI